MKLPTFILTIFISFFILPSNVLAAEGDADDGMDRFQVNGTRLHWSYYSAIGVYYNYPGVGSTLGSGSFNNEYDRLTKYSHCMSAAYGTRSSCVDQSKTHIEAANAACLVGAAYTTSVWGAAFTPVIGGIAGMSLTAACILTKDNALSEVDAFCDAAVEDLRVECGATYYPS